MLVSTKGIVLHKTKYADTSLIISIYTEEFGTRSFMIKNAFSKKKLVNYSRFTPLALIDIQFNFRKSDIHFIKEINFYYHFTTIPFDPVRHSLLIFYNELLYKLLFQYGDDKSLYQFIEKNIIALDTETTIPADIHIHFMVQLSRFLGFFPHNNYSEKNCHFFIHDASFQELYFDNGDFLSANTSHYLMEIIKNIEDPLYFVAVPKKTIRNELLYFMIRYFEIQNEGMKKIESIDILTQILN